MSGKTLHFRHGQAIIKEGDHSREAYIILSGEVLISKNGESLASLTKNEIFGELGWLQHTPRTATALAQGDNTSVQVLNEDEAERFMKHNPKALIPVLRIVCLRMKEMLNQHSKFN